MFEEVRSHLWFLKGVTNAQSRHLLEQDCAQCVHGNGVDIERFLKQLHTLKAPDQALPIDFFGSGYIPTPTLTTRKSAKSLLSAMVASAIAYRVGLFAQ